MLTEINDDYLEEEWQIRRASNCFFENDNEPDEGGLEPYDIDGDR